MSCEIIDATADSLDGLMGLAAEFRFAHHYTMCPACKCVGAVVAGQGEPRFEPGEHGIMPDVCPIFLDVWAACRCCSWDVRKRFAYKRTS